MRVEVDWKRKSMVKQTHLVDTMRRKHEGMNLIVDGYILEWRRQSWSHLSTIAEGEESEQLQHLWFLSLHASEKLEFWNIFHRWISLGIDLYNLAGLSTIHHFISFPLKYQLGSPNEAFLFAFLLSYYPQLLSSANIVLSKPIPCWGFWKLFYWLVRETFLQKWILGRSKLIFLPVGFSIKCCCWDKDDRSL